MWDVCFFTLKGGMTFDSCYNCWLYADRNSVFCMAQAAKSADKQMEKLLENEKK